MRNSKNDRDKAYCPGIFATRQLLTLAPQHAVRILYDKKVTENSGWKIIIDKAQQMGLKTEEAPSRVKYLSGSENAYVVTEFSRYTTKLSTDNHVVLVNPDTAGNLGTIIRTMAAFELNNLAIIRPAVDVWDTKVIRASMGSVFAVNCEYFDDFSDYRKKFTRNYYPFMTDGETELGKTTFAPAWSLIFGNEGAGLPEEFKAIGKSVRIEQYQGVDSLNLAIAAGIGMYAATKT